MVLRPRGRKLASPNMGPFLVTHSSPTSCTLRNLATGITFTESTANVRPLVLPSFPLVTPAGLSRSALGTC